MDICFVNKFLLQPTSHGSSEVSIFAKINVSLMTADIKVSKIILIKKNRKLNYGIFLGSFPGPFSDPLIYNRRT